MDLLSTNHPRPTIGIQQRSSTCWCCMFLETGNFRLDPWVLAVSSNSPGNSRVNRTYEKVSNRPTGVTPRLISTRGMKHMSNNDCNHPPKNNHNGFIWFHYITYPWQSWSVMKWCCIRVWNEILLPSSTPFIQATDRENHNRPTGVTPRLISTLGN